MNEIVTVSQKQLLSEQSTAVISLLTSLGLPADNIIADAAEREIIFKNLPQYIESLPHEVKRDARYLSKFVVGAGYGLFDYSLNSVWNEVTLALRNIAIAYGIDIFFDAAVGPKLRDAYQKEEDLAGLKEIVLLDTCKKLELITETTYKKLAHILDMRNNIGISHPTNYSINAFELLGWLQTSVQDVLNDRPSEAAIQVKAFIENLKSYQDVLSNNDIKSIEPKIRQLASHHCANIVRTLFGIFCAEPTTATTLKNISLLAPIAWGCCPDEPKYKLGIILEGYNNNLHKEKYARGCTFFEACGGNRFRSPSERVMTLQALSEDLLEKHRGWDNFYKEVPIIERIMTFVQNVTDVPPQIANGLIQTIVLCRIGNGVSYCNGVSPAGKKYYELFTGLLGDDYIPHVIVALMNYEIQRRLESKICLEQARQMLITLSGKAIDERKKEALQFLISGFESSGRAVFDSRFKGISKAFIT